MLRTDVEQKLRHMIIDTLKLGDIPAETLAFHENDFLEALGAHSFDVVEVVIAVEECFGFKFGQEQLRPELFRTFDGFLDAVCREIADLAAPPAPGRPPAGCEAAASAAKSA